MISRLATAVLGVLLMAVPAMGYGSCPTLCSCALDSRGRREVTCDTGGLRDPLPMMEMPMDTEVLIVDAPDSMYNTLTLGPIFKGLKKLEIVTVSKSRVPAIGEHSFWGLRHLHTLNISRNEITSLVAANFRGPEELKTLDLSRNSIESMPSAVFRYAGQLRNLNLAHNRLPELVPRVFFGLSALISLDLSYNPLGDLPGMVFSDIVNLKELRCISCGLITASDELLGNLQYVEHLDLSNNRLTVIPTVTKCKKLQSLILSGNLLTQVPSDAFQGLPLFGLSLSFNRIRSIHPQAFSNNTFLTHLDISYNRLGLMQLTNVLPVKSHALLNSDAEVLNSVANSELELATSQPSAINALIPIAANLKKLILSGNFLQLLDILPIMRQIRQLRYLGLGDLGLTKLPADFFRHGRHLRVLNVSGNALSDFQHHLLYSVPHLHSLFLDHNSLRGLSEDLVTAFIAMRSLLTIRLEGNPWHCDACQVSAMIAWLETASHQPHSTAQCRRPEGAHLCLKCTSPSPMTGLELVLLREEELPACGSTESSAWPAWLGRGSRSHSQPPRVMGVGIDDQQSQKDVKNSQSSVVTFFRNHLSLLVGVGCGLILALLIVVIASVVIVRRQSALYYTTEEEIERQEKLVGRNNNDSPVSRTTQTTPSPTPTKMTPYQPMAISRVHARTPITTGTFRSSPRKVSSTITTIDEVTALNTGSTSTT
ncbi:Leucine-rich repeat [Trinorchestia longiramus]|nr:Leucine-rich repeat [Trinorchestia longiramus]